MYINIIDTTCSYLRGMKPLLNDRSMLSGLILPRSLDQQLTQCILAVECCAFPKWWWCIRQMESTEAQTHSFGRPQSEHCMTHRVEILHLWPALLAAKIIEYFR